MSTPKLDPAQLTQAIEAVKEHGSVGAASRALRIPRATLQHRIKQAKNIKNLKDITPPQKQPGRTLADFRSMHDKNFIVPTRIRDGLAKLGNSWSYEVEFCRLANVSPQDLANHRDSFAEHVVLVERTKRVWAGTKNLAEKLREMVS